MYPWNRKKSDELDPEQSAGEIGEALRQFRDSLHAAADRPGFFWKRQHNAIMARINGPAAAPKWGAPLWVPAALALLLCLFFFAENSKAPTPDLPAGSDQMLLTEIERALSRDYPDALAPAGLIHDEINKASEQQSKSR